MGRPRKASSSGPNITPSQACDYLMSCTEQMAPQASHDWLESVQSLIQGQLDLLLDQGAVADSGEDDEWTDADLGDDDDDGGYEDDDDGGYEGDEE